MGGASSVGWSLAFGCPKTFGIKVEHPSRPGPIAWRLAGIESQEEKHERHTFRRFWNPRHRILPPVLRERTESAFATSRRYCFVAGRPTHAVPLWNCFGCEARAAVGAIRPAVELAA